MLPDTGAPVTNVILMVGQYVAPVPAFGGKGARSHF